MLGLFPPNFSIHVVIPSYTFFFLLKPEGFDSVSSLGFRDSFSAKLSRIWQIASRDSVTIFLFHVACKRVFFPSNLPYCLVRTLKSRKSFPIPSPKGLNEREKINSETMAKDFNNRLITPELEKPMQDYRSIPRIARRRILFASQCFSSAMLDGTFLKDSKRMMILCSLASL